MTLLEVVRDTDVDFAIDAEGAGDVLDHEVTDVLARDFRDDAAREPGVADGVVASLRAGFIGRRELFDPAQAGLPVGCEIDRQWAWHAVQAGLVAHGLGDRDLRLAVLGELRPVLRDGGVVFEQSAVGENMDSAGSHALGRGEGREEGLRIDRAGVADIGEAGPGMHQLLAVAVSGDLRAELRASRNLVLEEGLDFVVECGVDGHGGYSGAGDMWTEL